MGSGFSTSNDDDGKSSTTPGLEDLPENCLAMVLAHLDPPDICNLARTNRAFHRASSADFIWESKLPSNYKILANKLMSSFESLAKRDVYAGLCCPTRISSGTKEVWMEKERGGMCMLVSWKGMKITGIDDRRYWTHIPTLHSRFHTIAYLQQMWWLEVEGDLEFEFPAGSYSLYFRLRLGRPSKGQNRQCTTRTQDVHGWHVKPVRFHFSVSNSGQSATCEHFLKEQGKWLRYRVGDFVIEDSYRPTKIKFSMTQIDCTHQKGGLALDSVFICSNKLN
ncbi:F-box protein PP2-A13-like [Rutidosis leptorrhynchoides]|uniref:F-box protein PP2-A13-like n=1 Tax=Rutidosis leptorrhynchoides TaxID=125765 RepID=UPI003A990559